MHGNTLTAFSTVSIKANFLRAHGGKKFILRLIYFRTPDFKGLSMVATVPDHQSNKTCWHCSTRR